MPTSSSSSKASETTLPQKKRQKIPSAPVAKTNISLSPSSIHSSPEDHFHQSNIYFKKLIDLVPPKAYFNAQQSLLGSQLSSSNDNKNVITSTAQDETSLLSEVAQSSSLSDGGISKRKMMTNNNNNSSRSERVMVKKAKLDPAHPSKTSELQHIIQMKLSKSSDHDVAITNVTGSTDSINCEKSEGKLLNGQSSFPAHKHGNIKSKSKGDGKFRKGASHQAFEKDEDDVAVSNSAEVSSGIVMKSVDDEGVEASSSSGDASKRASPATVTTRFHPDQLREKLRSRINELQNKRQKGMTPEEFLESKKLRRKESKLKLKQKRKEAKKLKLSIEKQAKNSAKKLNGVSEIQPSTSDVKSANSNIVFSKFEFSEQAKKPKDKKAKKPKSYKELYEKVIWGLFCCCSNVKVVKICLQLFELVKEIDMR